MIYVLLVDGFEDIEALEPVDILRRADIPVKLVGVNSKTVVASHKTSVNADIIFEEISREDMTMLVLPGGAGHHKLDESEKVQELITYAVEKGIYIAAICASPSIIGKRGLLNGRKYTCYPGYEKLVEGGIFTSGQAVLDGNFLTARGAGASSDFGFKMVEIFKGKSAADTVRKKMCFE